MIYLVVGLIGGSLAAILASGKKRNPVGWFVIGFLLPLIGLILIIVLPKGEDPFDVKQAMQAPTGWPPPQPPRDTSLEALAKLGELRDRGVVSSQEFEAKKKELLGRM